MRVIEKQVISSRSPEELFHLVANVDDYAHFVPHCRRSRSEKISESKVRGELVFSALGLEQSFSTINTLFPFEKILMHLDQGPFKTLEGLWSFAPLEGAQSAVTLSLSFEFSTHWMDVMFSSFFDRFATGLVTAFVKKSETFIVDI